MPQSDYVKLPYQLRLKFSASIDEVEDWLETNCNGRFAYSLEGVVETDTIFNKLEILFSFEFDTDREKFKKAVTSGTF